MHASADCAASFVSIVVIGLSFSLSFVCERRSGPEFSCCVPFSHVNYWGVLVNFTFPASHYETEEGAIEGSGLDGRIAIYAKYGGNGCNFSQGYYTCHFSSSLVSENDLSSLLIKTENPGKVYIVDKNTENPGPKACISVLELEDIMEKTKCKGKEPWTRSYPSAISTYSKKYNHRSTLLRADEIIAVIMPILMPAAVSIVRTYIKNQK